MPKQTFPLLFALPFAIWGQSDAPGRPPLRLSLKRAVEIALAPEGSTRIQLAQESLRQAESRSAQARAALLPDIAASVSQQNLNRNLAAFGVRFELPIPGFEFPRVVGPFNVFDVRATASQSIFDFSSIRRYQASRVAIKAVRSDLNSTDDQVAAQTARAYLSALRAEADLEAVQANITLADAVLKQVEDQKKAGTGTGIEITRARVQLSNERQRFVVAQNERRRARLQLLRTMGLRLDTTVELTDRLSYVAVEPSILEKAAEQAVEFRADLKAQLEREENARLASSATTLDRLPSLAAFADYGTIGTSINSALPTRTYGVALRVPVFDGGRRDARRSEGKSQFRQEKVRTSDLREQIDLEVRLALDSLRSAEEQVKVAEEGLTLADSEFAQARRRYDAGVAGSLEVTDAQTRLERARDNRIAALFSHHQARIDLGQATGTIRRMIQ